MNDHAYTFEGQESVISPQLVYYRDIIADNIKKMIELAGGTERLWPHVKTHKMIEVVKMMMAQGITKFKCATIAEAEMCADAGADKVTLAYPLVGPNIERFVNLAGAYPNTEFFAISDCTKQVELIGAMAMEKGRPVNLLADVDTGQHRTGVPMGKVAEYYRTWASIPGIVMRGMHCYDGHRHETDYEIRNREVTAVDLEIAKIKENILSEGLDCGILIMGGTPSFPCHRKLNEEYLSPGTCIIQDAGYRAAYPDLDFVPGAAVLTRVVSVQGNNTFTLDMGTKAVATDPIPERAVLAGMEYAKTVLQNEEHWVVEVPKEHAEDIPQVGDVLFAIPVHVCPTSALYPEVPVISGGKLTDWWQVTARNRKITL